MVMLRCWLGFVNGGSLVVISMMVVFFIFGLVFGGSCSLKCEVMVFSDCIVYFRLLLFVFGNLMMMLYFVSWFDWMFWNLFRFLIWLVDVGVVISSVVRRVRRMWSDFIVVIL